MLCTSSGRRLAIWPSIGGGGGSRKKITFALTPVPNYGGRPTPPPDPKDPKPTGDWKL